MKKVVYAVTRVGKYGNSKMTGFGFINETDLIALYKGTDGKRHRRVYEDCLKTCLLQYIVISKCSYSNG